MPLIRLLRPVLILALILLLPIPVASWDASAAPVGPLGTSMTRGSANAIQPAPLAAGVILIGLRSGGTAQMTNLGVQSSAASLTSLFTQLGVQAVQPLFPVTKQPTIAATPSEPVADLRHIYRIQVAPDTNILAAVQLLRSNAAVAYAEPDYLAQSIAMPNDPLTNEQWALARMQLPAAWDVVTGTADITIAVVDSGLDTSHPDLADQLWVNPGELAGNGLDDDSNGHVDDIHGWNLVDNTADLSDTTGHGTQVAGIVAATTNNGVGVAGVCWNCRLMGVKVGQSGGVANYSDIAAGITYAAQKGARVINVSLGGHSDSVTLRMAVAAASQSAVVVGGAGNDANSALFYPAAYDQVLAVAGTTNNDERVGTSNYGSWVDIAAPGEAIPTTFSGGTYGTSSGTSLAAPFASGLAGLLLSQNSAWSPAEVRAHIIHTTDPIDGLNPGFADLLGSGRINAGTAVTTRAIPNLNLVGYSVNNVPDGTPAPGMAVSLTMALRNTWGRAMVVSGTLHSGDPAVTISTPTATFGTIDTFATSTNATPFHFSIAPNAPFAHLIAFSLTISAADGFSTSIPLTVTTQNGLVSVGGTISSDTTWTSDRTYLVTSPLQVSSGVTLTIQPGTVVKFDPGTSLRIGGTLIADGTPEREIVFTSAQANPPPGVARWFMEFLSTAIDAGVAGNNTYLHGSIFRYVQIQRGRGIHLCSALPYFSHVVFTRNTNYAPSSGGPCGGGALGWSGSRTGSLIVRDSSFVDNDLAFSAGSGLQFEVSGTQFLRNRLGVIATTDAPAGSRLVGNTFKSNDRSIILLGSDGGVLISNNVIDTATTEYGSLSFGMAIDIESGSPTINHNTFANIQSGPSSACGGECAVIAGGSPLVIDNTFTGNRIHKLIYGSDGIYQHNNWVGNQVGFILRRESNNTQGVTGTHNYWGTTDTSVIDGLIYDSHDDFQPGEIRYQPIRTSPNPAAPAYLHDVAVSPDVPGIERATITLTFSAPSDQSIAPMVSFGATYPYTDYAVLDNTEWISSTQWRGTYDVTSLLPRGAYGFNVSGSRGADGMEIPTDTRFGFTVDYAGQITDQTPPPPPSVLAGGKLGDSSSVRAQWMASDPQSPIIGYRYAIGSASGATDIVGWTATSGTAMERNGLGFVSGRQYWVVVQAQNAGGLWSASATSAFSAGQSPSVAYLPLTMK